MNFIFSLMIPLFLFHSCDIVTSQTNSDLNPFSENSKCHKAIDFKKYGYIRERLPKKSRVNVNVKSPSLKIINPGLFVAFQIFVHDPVPGPGTTGTRTIQNALCEVLWIRSWHFRDNCKQTETSDFRIISTFQNEATFHESRRGAKEKIQKAMRSICSSAIAIGDTPSSEFYVDLSLLVPKAVTIFTFRDPVHWASRRITAHAQEVLLCDFNLWEHPVLLHPFDLTGCLEACPSCIKPFMSLFEFAYGESFSRFKPTTKDVTSPDVMKKLKHIEAAYVRMNTVNMMMASGKEVLPLCLWDLQGSNVTSSVESVARIVMEFLKNSSLNNSFPDLSIHNKAPERLIPTKTRDISPFHHRQ